MALSTVSKPFSLRRAIRAPRSAGCSQVRELMLRRTTRERAGRDSRDSGMREVCASPADGAAARSESRSVPHRNAYAALLRHLHRAVVARVDVADDAHAGVVGEHPLDLLRGEVGAVGDTDLARVQGAAHPDAAAVVEGHPGGTRGGVDKGVED